MQNTDPGHDIAKGPGHRAKALARIRQKLERILHNPHPELATLRPEIDGIIDALHALNRDASDMRRHGHRGEHDVD